MLVKANTEFKRTLSLRISSKSNVTLVCCQLYPSCKQPQFVFLYGPILAAPSLLLSHKLLFLTASIFYDRNVLDRIYYLACTVTLQSLFGLSFERPNLMEGLNLINQNMMKTAVFMQKPQFSSKKHGFQ